MKFAIKDYKEAIKNVEKFAKEKGIKLDAYDFEFLCDGYNCQLTWNPASHIMPYSETSKDFYGKEVTTYYTYFQLSQKCSFVCSMQGCYDKELILKRLRDTRSNEQLDKLEKLKYETERAGLKLFAITFYGDKFGLIKAKDIQMNNDQHIGLIAGGEYDGYSISIQGFFQIIGIRSDMTKYIASKRLVGLEKLKRKGKYLSMKY